MRNLILLIIIGTSSLFWAQTPEEMEAWNSYMTPSETHQILAKSNGEWNAHVTMWMDPNVPPTVSEGTCSIKMILDGRYQESDFMSDFQGMPMKGKSILSFDNATQEFSSIWIDNFGTGMMVLKGHWTEMGKTIHYEGSMVDPMTGKPEKVQEEYRFVDENTEIMTMYFMKEGEKLKSMEIVFTRK